MHNLNAQEARLVKDAIIRLTNSLLEVCAHITGKSALNQYQPNAEVFSVNYPEFNEVKGQTKEKLAIESGVASSYFSVVERDLRNIALLNICKLAETLGVKTKYLMDI